MTATHEIPHSSLKLGLFVEPLRSHHHHHHHGHLTAELDWPNLLHIMVPCVLVPQRSITTPQALGMSDKESKFLKDENKRCHPASAWCTESESLPVMVFISSLF